MRKITYLKTMLVAIALIYGSASSSAQLLTEDFSYTAGTLLTANGWTAHSGSGTNAITVNASSISYPGYASSGVGNEVTLTTSGEDDNKSFTTQSSGSVYAAFIVNITSATTTGDYFFHFCQSSGSGAAGFFGRVFVKKDASNNLAFGLSKSAGTAVYSSFSYSLGTSYLVVLKYTFNASASDDVAYLFINPTIGSTEPLPLLTTTDVATDATGIPAIALRQGSASNAPGLKLDGIRVSNIWADVVSAPGNPKTAVPTFSAIPGNVIVSQSVSLSSTTADASIYYTTDGTIPSNSPLNGTLYSGTAIQVSATTTIKAIAYATGYDPSTVAIGTYTFPTIVTTINALRGSSTSGFYQLTSQSLLTFQNAVGKVKFIQDGTAGIVIYDVTPKITTTYANGDILPNIYCTISMYNGMLEIIPFTDPGAAVSSGNTVTPTIVTLATIGNYIGQLVKVKNVTITGAGNFAASTAAGTYLAINDGTAGYLRVAYTDLPYINTAIPSLNQDITGVVNMYSTTEPDLIPRIAADMVNSPLTSLKQASANSGIYASNGSVIFSATAGQSVEVYNSVGQRLLQKQAVLGLNALPVSTKGVLFVKVGNNIAKVIL